MSKSAYGFLPRYADASFSKLRKDSARELRILRRKFMEISKDKFYKERFNIYLYSSYRVGKTWILHAIANYIIEKYIENSVYYVTLPKLMDYFMKGSMYDEDTTWVNFLASRRVLIIDDVGQEYRSKSGFAETKFENLIRWRFNHKKITYLAGNGNLEALEQLYGESLSAFIDGEYIVIDIEDTRNLSKIILKNKLKMQR